MSALSSAQVSERFAVSMAMKFGGDRLQPTEIRIKAQIDKRPSKTWHTMASPRTTPLGASLFQTHAADPCSLAKIRGVRVRFGSKADVTTTHRVGPLRARNRLSGGK